ncbi:putative mitochondrial protein [Andalucia godoyi]|uniref:Putative mitochondrial protein n=1 Tax=Andalucia godoyi TaxID=505711 RepID=A0A8K0AHW0_ANDGO|nr:putative mitochondrial protein [Andalucia godoyi]|eukprot:ANDGO_04163.mRNA.1 putative mitochondrial protein
MVSLSQIFHKIAARPGRARGATTGSLKVLWDAIGASVHKFMLNGKAVLLPDFGTFTFQVTNVPAGDLGQMTTRVPHFSPAESFCEKYSVAAAHMDSAAPVAPLSFFAVASAAKLSQGFCQNAWSDIVEAIGQACANGELVSIDAGFVTLFLCTAKTSAKFNASFLENLAQVDAAENGPTATHGAAVFALAAQARNLRIAYGTNPVPQSSSTTTAAAAAAAAATTTTTNSARPSSATSRPSSASKKQPIHSSAGVPQPQLPARPSSAIKRHDFAAERPSSAKFRPPSANGRPMSARSYAHDQRDTTTVAKASNSKSSHINNDNDKKIKQMADKIKKHSQPDILVVDHNDYAVDERTGEPIGDVPMLTSEREETANEFEATGDVPLLFEEKQAQQAQSSNAAANRPSSSGSGMPKRPVSTQSQQYRPSSYASNRHDENNRPTSHGSFDSIPASKERSALLKQHIQSLYRSQWDDQIREREEKKLREKELEHDMVKRSFLETSQTENAEQKKQQAWRDAEREIMVENRRRAELDRQRRREDNAPQPVGSVLPQDDSWATTSPAAKAFAITEKREEINRAWNDQVEDRRNREREERELEDAFMMDLISKTQEAAVAERQDGLLQKKKIQETQASFYDRQIRERDPVPPKFVESVDIFGAANKKHVAALRKLQRPNSAASSASLQEYGNDPRSIAMEEAARKRAESQRVAKALLEQQRQQEQAEKARREAELAETQQRLRAEQEEIEVEKERDRLAKKMTQDYWKQQWDRQQKEKVALQHAHADPSSKTFIVGIGESTEQEDRALQIALNENPGVKKISTKTRAIYGW